MKAAIILFDGIEELDFAGPYEVLGIAGQVFTVAPQREIKGHHGLRVTADFTFDHAPAPDVLVIPGGPVTRENPASLDSVVAYVAKTAPACRTTVTVCTGAFIAARAGILDGRSVTTHYRRRHLLAAQFPQVQVKFARVVADGKIISTAGVAAGIDGALYTVARHQDLEAARKIAKTIEHPWHSAHVLHSHGLHDHEEAMHG